MGDSLPLVVLPVLEPWDGMLIANLMSMFSPCVLCGVERVDHREIPNKTPLHTPKKNRLIENHLSDPRPV